MIRIVFLKSTVLPFESVIRPSSSTCNSTLNTSGCAFSTSSKRTTEYGFRLTASVSCPPSSYPTYPGGAPISRATLCFSMYSLISIRTMFASLSNNAAASDFASSVLPTPVGPRNKNDPIGFVGSLIPAFERMMESLTNCTATSCPTTRLCNSSPRCKVLLRSLSVSFATGIPVHFATIFAISSSVTHSCTRLLSFSLTCASRRSNSCLICGSLPYCSSAAFSRLYSRCAT